MFFIESNFFPWIIGSSTWANTSQTSRQELTHTEKKNKHIWKEIDTMKRKAQSKDIRSHHLIHLSRYLNKDFLNDEDVVLRQISGVR